MTTLLLDTEIKYNRANHDYDILVANVVVASAPDYRKAESIRTQALAERRDEGLYASASELDGGADPIEIDDPPLPNEIPGTNPPRCSGFEYPCNEPAMHEFHALTGNDLETARSVSIWLCEKHFIEWGASVDPDPIPPWSDDPQPGRAVARQWHRTPRQFIATLRQLDVTAWLTLAEAYAEWYGTTAEATLDCWLLAVQGTNVPANARS